MKWETSIRHIRPGVLAAGAIATLGLCAFSLSAHLTLGSQADTGATESLAAALLGEARVMLGDRLYKQADVYFHRGLDYVVPENRLSNHWATRLRHQLEPQKHLHAEGEQQIREIMPWLELTMRINPDDQESALVAAYWLVRHLDRPDLAEQVLLRAQRQTPFAYAVQLEKAKLHLHEDRRQPALAALNATLAFWQRTGNPDNHEDQLARAEALLLRGLLLEIDNKPLQAASDYRELLALFPDRSGPQRRLQALEQGQIPDPPADTQIRRLTHAAHAHNCELEHACEHEH
jgi:tetratricopeptide (TPR) repeat protein